MQSLSTNLLDKGRSLNVLKTFRRRPECLMYGQLDLVSSGRALEEK